MKKVILRTIDRTVLMGVLMDETETTITISDPVAMSYAPTPDGQLSMSLVPYDMVFNDVLPDKNNVTFKKSHVMWEKDLADFPSYDAYYTQSTTQLDIPQQTNPGIIY